MATSGSSVSAKSQRHCIALPENIRAQRKLRAEVSQLPSDRFTREWMHYAEMARHLPNEPATARSVELYLWMTLTTSRC